MSRHHTHTNALNPLASSASVGEGLRSHGGASLLPGGLVGRSGSGKKTKLLLTQRLHSCCTEEEEEGDEEQSQD